MNLMIKNLKQFTVVITLLFLGLISSIFTPNVSATNEITNTPPKPLNTPLSGPWQVIRNDIVSPADFGRLYQGETTKFPDRWHDGKENPFNKDWPSGYGSASYRLTLPQTDTEYAQAIKIQTPYSAYKVWINGALIAGNGVVSKTPENFQAFYLERIIPLPNTPNIEIVLNVANFEHFAGGVLRPPILGSRNQLEQAAKAYDLSYLFVLGALCALLVFQLAYFFRSLSGGIEWSHFWYCILLAVLIVRLTTLTTMPFKLFPSIPQVSTKTLEYLTLFSSSAVYMTFLASMFPKEFPRLIRHINYLVTVPFVTAVIFFPVSIFTQLQDAFILFALISLLYSQGAVLFAWRRKRNGAGAVLLFTAFFILTAVNDSLLYLHSVNVRPASFPDLMPFGFLLLSVGYAIALSSQSRAVYDRAQRLSGELLQLNKTLDEKVIARTKEATEAKHAAEKSAKEKTNFISAASHDLRQPVHALGLFNQTLEHSVKSSPMLQSIANKQQLLIKSLSEMLETMLEASQLEAKTLTAQIIDIKLKTIFDEIYNTLQLTASQNGTKLTIAPSSLSIKADPKHFKRILTNLTCNAIKAAPDGHVLIGARNLGSLVSIDVLDNGIGISSHDQKRIFDRYVQLKNKTTSGPAGLGLGLSIVMDLSNLMDMPITFESKEGKGTHFRIRAQKAIENKPSKTGLLNTPKSSPKRLVILVVDDDIKSLDAMVSMCRQWGHAARGAESFKEAMATLEDLGKPALMITDYRLAPNITWLDLSRETSTIHKDLNTIIVTGATSPEDLQELANSPLRVFHKPLNPNDIKSLLTEL